MKINIVAAGVIKDTNLENLMQHYLKQFKLLKPNIIEINCKNLSNDKANTKLLDTVKIFNQSYNILLDEQGEIYSSYAFSKLILNLTQYKHINFIIGPNDGFNSASKNTAHQLMSLSLLTFPHKLARLLLVEQLYRAESIINNTPYHKE